LSTQERSPTITLPREVVRDLYHALWDRAIDTSYGVACIVSDPRDWHPDPECTSPEEFAAHADAVKRAEAGETVEIPRHRWEVRDTAEDAQALISEPGVAAVTVSERKDGKYVAHVNVQSWGMGTSTMYDPPVCNALTALHDAIKTATGENWDNPIPPWHRNAEVGG
jgi:hypothetical protein